VIKHDFTDALRGKDGDDIASIYDFLEWHIHYVGRRGIASSAISVVDIALWDIKCKKAGQPLWEMACGAGNSCKAYRGGIDLMFP